MAKGLLRPADMKRRHRLTLGLVATALLILIVVVAVSSYRAALLDSSLQAHTRLTLQVNGFTRSLEKYRVLAPLIARRSDILSVLSSRGDDDDMETAQLAMTRLAGMSDSIDIELTFADGEQFSLVAGQEAVSTDEQVRKRNRHDLTEAKEGRLGRQLIVSDIGRFYVFSSAVRIDGEVAGVISVWVDLSETEQIWALSTRPIVATDGQQVFLSNRDGLRGAQMVGEQVGPNLLKSGQRMLSKRRSLFGPIILEASIASVSAIERDYVASRMKDPLLGWTFYSMEPLRDSVFVAAIASLTATLFAGLLLGALWVAFNRQQQQLNLRRKDIASSLWLERRVKERTRELRQTQAGLIHSAKLAAIGQMSAVLSHEYNQPLAAIRSYADNAQLLFEKGRMQQGQDNLTRIGKLVDKLANLSKTLKSFARKPGVDTKAVSVEAVVDESAMLMLPQLKKEGIELAIHHVGQDFNVMAGHTRLEQVLINLIANARDAIEAMPEEGEGVRRPHKPLIRIDTDRLDGMGVITVADNGPGIGVDKGDDIFEPFVTSKEHGVGLGLGLPIAVNLINGFGGSLAIVEPHDDTMSTCFEIRLPLADANAIEQKATSTS